MKRKQPWFTILLIAFSIGYFIYFLYLDLNFLDISMYPPLNGGVGIDPLGAPSAIAIYQGEYYGLITNSLVHKDWFILLPNVVALFFLGKIIENRSKFYTLFLLGLFASVITSLIELTISGDTGIGMSGVSLFLLWYIVTRSIKDKDYNIKHRSILLLIGATALLLFVALHLFVSANIAIYSILSGTLLGAITGGIASTTKGGISSIIVLFILSAGLSLTLFNAPWSVQWNLYKAYNYHDTGDYHDAKFHYRKAIEINGGHQKSAEENLTLIKIDELSEQALEMHNNRKFLEAGTIYHEILHLDPTNQWAKEQVKKLP